ncbi:MAG: BspA family leucine-rich repeat surface protein [Candidatus Thiodubiliella endoseptemdiera]|uniref:BspA family leucine-rich repeat surface protein n=1 Tax=Candidatus Thiodubiliella endoseptemdiera TaxID=2738886 RepID=A0A853F4Z4_9GAMM|nr:BspA family leucine-rich repeat surface protein [Candidatus Thiodubiliella endoseptemdiera]
MMATFHSCSKFNQDLSKWKTSNVETMKYLFAQCLTSTVN